MMKSLLGRYKFTPSTNLGSAPRRNPNILFVVMAVSFFMGLSIVALSVNFDYIILFAFVFGLPLSLFVLTVLPTTISKVKHLTAQLQWWHFLWLLIFMSGLVFRVRGIETLQEGTIDAWALYRIGLVGLVAFILLIRLILRKTNWLKSLFQGLIGLLTCYVLVAIASTFWSFSPSWTLYKSTEFLIDVILIAAIVVSVRNVREFKTLFDWTWVLLVLALLSVWIGWFFWPDLATKARVGSIAQIRGVLPIIDSNTVGDYAAMVGLVGIARFLTKEKMRNYKVHLALIIFAVGTMFIAYSRTPMAGFFFGSIVILLLTKKLRPPLAVALICFVMIIVLTPIGSYVFEYLKRGEPERNITTLTGRTYGWIAALKAVEERPFGYGAYAGSRFYLPLVLDWDTTSSVDNEWLEILTGVGVVGFSIIVFTLVLLWVWLLRLYKFTQIDSTAHNLIVEAIPVLVFVMFRSFFVTNFLIWHPPLIFFLILGYIEFLRRSYKDPGYEDTYYSQSLSTARR